MKKVLLSISLFCMAGTLAQAQTIAAIRAMAVGSTVTVKGRVTNGAELGVPRYCQDGTAGIVLYGASLSTVNRGDSVSVTGTLSMFNNLLEVSPVSSHTVISTGHPSPTPIVLTPSQFADTYEAELIQVNSCTFNTTCGVFAGNTNYNLTTGGGQTLQIRVASASTLVGKPIPAGSIAVTGLLSQFCSTPTTGCTTGWQLLLRDSNDVVYNSPIVITNNPTASNITTSGFTLNWTTNTAGNAFVKYGTTPALTGGTVVGSLASASSSVTLTGLNPATFYYVKAFTVSGIDTAAVCPAIYITKSNSPGTIKCYFNRTVDHSVASSPANYATQLTGVGSSIADTLVAYINRAQNSLDIAIYNWDNAANLGATIASAVNAAYSRGVKIRIIADGSTTQSGTQLLNTSIPIMGSPQGTGYTIMHNKFVIADVYNTNNAILWTGSTNWTSQQLTTDANNAIIFNDQSLAKAYKREFDEMWGDTTLGGPKNAAVSLYGQYKTDNTPHEFNVGGKRVECYFSPSDHTNTHILQTIGTANTELYFSQYVITRSDLAAKIAGTLTTSGITGANGRGILDDTTGASGPYFTMRGVMNSNLGIKPSPPNTWLLHHKYMIVDQANAGSDPLVWTGSHNWSNAGDQKNDENSVVVHDINIANQYYQEFTQRGNDFGFNGIKESTGLNAAINVYPNPNNGEFFLEIYSNESQKMQVSAYDITGRVMFTSSINAKQGANRLSFDLNELSNGVYMLEVSNGTSRKVNKLVINK